MKWRSKLESNDADLFIYFDNHLTGQTDCKNKDCNCLILLTDKLPCKAVARYLVWFKRKTKGGITAVIMMMTEAVDRNLFCKIKLWWRCQLEG